MTRVVEAQDKFVLECPACGVRFNLKRYVPDKKVRCKKCRAIMRIPVVEAHLTDAEKSRFVGGGEADARVDAQVARILSLPRLAVMTVSMLVLLGAGVYMFWKRAQRPPTPVATKTTAHRLTAEWLAKNNKRFDYPLGLGFEWAYAVGDRQEERRVVAQAGGAQDNPQFEVVAAAVRESIRIEDEGVMLVRETRGADAYAFDPPLCVMRLPLVPGDVWTYEGRRAKEGGAAEAWSLEFRVSTEIVDTAIGKKDCFKVQMTGTRGAAKVEETCWYTPGVGLVRRVTSVDGKGEEAKIVRFKQ